MTSFERAPRVDVLGVHVSTVDMPTALRVIEDWITGDDRQYVCVTGVHGVMESASDLTLLDIHNRSGLTVPDGMPMVWMGRRAGAEWMERVCGPDLMLELSDRAARRGWRCFFYGGAPGVADRLAGRLENAYPGLQVAGTFSPPFRPLEPDEAAEVAKMINDAQPDIVWVGLSTPKQERWMAEFRPMLEAPAIFGVGAAFDLHAGLSTRAPGWMQRSGMEWLYRLTKEPKRLWRRYLTNNPRFALRSLLSPPRLVDPSGRGLARGKFVVIVGPDGAGKTAVAEELLARMPGRYFHFRPPFLRRNMPRRPPPQSPPPSKDPGPSPVVLGWARLLRNWMSTWVGYQTAVRPALRRGETVVGDRGLYGYAAQPGPLKFSGPDWLARWVIRLSPDPELVVNLRAPAHVIRARKGELTEEQIEAELRAWSEVPASTLVDVDSNRPLSEVVDEVQRQLESG